MSFAAPLWLLAGAAVVGACALGLRAADRRRRRDLERFASAEILPDLTHSLSRRRRRAKRALRLCALALAFAALAGPQAGFRWEETQRRGIDVLIAIDVSRSMLARDVRPDRLRRSKLAVEDLVRRLGGDRLGLIAFAGTAFLQCPLTLDQAAFQRALDALEPGIIPAPGSDLASALDEARKALRTEAKNVKLLILLSDGEDLQGEALAAARRAAEEGIRVFTVGVGTPSGELIPLPEDEGGFVKDESGQIVKSRLDEATLRRVAEITGGLYVPLGPRAEGIDELVERALAPIPREELASRLRRVPRNRYQWPLSLALCLLLVEPFLSERERRPATPLGIVAPLVLVLGLATAAGAASAEEAARLYAEGRYEDAARAYRELAAKEDDPKLDLNLGVAAYRAGEYAEAAAAFARALRGEEDALKSEAFYDLGNAQYRIGEKKRDASPGEAAAAWRQAVAAYEEALAIDEHDEDARFNRDFVKRKLEELEQQMREQEQEREKEQQEERPQASKPATPQREDAEQESRSPTATEEPSPGQAAAPRPESKAPSGAEDLAPEAQPGSPQSTPPEPKGSAPAKSSDSAADQPGARSDAPRSEDRTPDEGSTPPSASGAPGRESPPGRLSPAQARELLEALGEGEDFMPIGPAAKEPASEADERRNW